MFYIREGFLKTYKHVKYEFLVKCKELVYQTLGI